MTLDNDGDTPTLYLTVGQAAKELQIGRTLAYQLASEFLSTNGVSGLPVIRAGKLLRVRRSDLEGWSHQPNEPQEGGDQRAPSRLPSIKPPTSRRGSTQRPPSTGEQPPLPFSA